MSKVNNLTIFLVLLLMFFVESAQAPISGFYVVPTIVSILFIVFSPFISQLLNVFLAGFLGWMMLSLWQWQILYFTVPYFLILSLIFYVFDEK